MNVDKIDLLAGGGIAGKVEAAHAKMSKPTQLHPVGLLADADGKVINIASYMLPPSSVPSNITVLGVFGASMNAGKTTAVVSLARGLQNAGYKVAGVEVFAALSAKEGVPVSAFATPILLAASQPFARIRAESIGQSFARCCLRPSRRCRRKRARNADWVAYPCVSLVIGSWAGLGTSRLISGAIVMLAAFICLWALM